MNKQVARAALLALLFSVVRLTAAAFLDVDDAFRFTARFDADRRLVLDWAVQPGYSLLVERIAIKRSNNRESWGWRINRHWQNSQGHHLLVSLFGTTPSTSLALEVKYQGCAPNRFCYAPCQRHLDIRLNGNNEPELIGITPAKATPRAWQLTLLLGIAVTLIWLARACMPSKSP